MRNNIKPGKSRRTIIYDVMIMRQKAKNITRDLRKVRKKKEIPKAITTLFAISPMRQGVVKGVVLLSVFPISRDSEEDKIHIIYFNLFKSNYNLKKMHYTWRIIFSRRMDEGAEAYFYARFRRWISRQC